MLQDRVRSVAAFDVDAAVNAVLYIAQRLDTPTFHKVSKLLYFADKYHLEHYGRFICGDSYLAMQHGPVPSGVYDLLKAVRDGVPLASNPAFVDTFARHLEVHSNHHIHPKHDADLDYLSDSDVESLDYALEHYGALSFRELTNVSHDEAYESAGYNDIIELESIVRTFADGEALLEHLRDPFPDDPDTGSTDTGSTDTGGTDTGSTDTGGTGRA